MTFDPHLTCLTVLVWQYTNTMLMSKGTYCTLALHQAHSGRYTEDLQCPLTLQMIDSRLAAQRRAMRTLPLDRGLQKTSTYIVPCFLFVEVSGLKSLWLLVVLVSLGSHVEIWSWSDLKWCVPCFWDRSLQLKANVVLFVSDSEQKNTIVLILWTDLYFWWF